MADSKLEKALYGPSVTEVALGAVLGLLAGVLAAAVFLVFKPVATVKVMPAADKQLRSMVYYVQGAESTAKSKNWQTKQKQFLAGTAVSVGEEELNAWAASFGAAAPAAAPKGAPKPKTPEKPKPKAAPKAEGDDAAAADGFFIPYAPNFKMVADNKLQIGLKCTLNWFGLTYDTTVVAIGDFKKSGDGVAFSPDKVYLGSCPLHLIPALSGLLTSHIIAKEKASDEIRTAWTKLNTVTIEGGAVKMSVQ